MGRSTQINFTSSAQKLLQSVLAFFVILTLSFDQSVYAQTMSRISKDQSIEKIEPVQSETKPKDVISILQYQDELKKIENKIYYNEEDLKLLEWLATDGKYHVSGSPRSCKCEPEYKSCSEDEYQLVVAKLSTMKLDKIQKRQESCWQLYVYDKAAPSTKKLSPSCRAAYQKCNTVKHAGRIERAEEALKVTQEDAVLLEQQRLILQKTLYALENGEAPSNDVAQNAGERPATSIYAGSEKRTGESAEGTVQLETGNGRTRAGSPQGP